MIGSKFHRLTIIATSETRIHGHVCWEVRCVCGTIKPVSKTDMRSGRVKSCGCLNAELRIARNTKHGYVANNKKPKLYYVWQAMIQRCVNPNSKSWKWYGARGISVSPRWLNSFESFLDDMGDRPTPRHQIDRRDNDGDYTPENCQWSTPSQNCLNRRPKNCLTYNA